MIDKHDILLRFKNCCSFDLYRRPVNLDHQITGTRLSLYRIRFLLLEEKHRRKLHVLIYTLLILFSEKQYQIVVLLYMKGKAGEQDSQLSGR